MVADFFARPFDLVAEFVADHAGMVLSDVFSFCLDRFGVRDLGVVLSSAFFEAFYFPNLEIDRVGESSDPWFWDASFVLDRVCYEREVCCGDLIDRVWDHFDWLCEASCEGEISFFL